MWLLETMTMAGQVHSRSERMYSTLQAALESPPRILGEVLLGNLHKWAATLSLAMIARKGDHA